MPGKLSVASIQAETNRSAADRPQELRHGLWTHVLTQADPNTRTILSVQESREARDVVRTIRHIDESGEVNARARAICDEVSAKPNIHAGNRSGRHTQIDICLHRAGCGYRGHDANVVEVSAMKRPKCSQ